MANYKVVYRDDNPTWQQGCPILIEALQVSRDADSQRAFLQMKARNISGDPIDAIEVEASVSSPDGAVEKVQFSSLDADVAPNREWTPKAQELSHPEVSHVCAVVKRAGSMASFGPSAERPAEESLSLSPGAARAREAELASNKLDHKKLQNRLIEGDGWWICSCGSLNVGRDSCRACGASKDLLSRLEDEGWLEERDRELRYQRAKDALSAGKEEKLRQAKEEFEELGGYRDSAEMAEKCAEASRQAEQGRKRTGEIAGIAIAALALAIAGFFIVTKVVVPRSTYDNALSLAESGDYEGAISELESLGDYGDAAEQIDRIKYDRAISLYEGGDFEGAIAELRSLGGYGDAAQQVERIAYEWAISLYEDGDYVLAIEKLEALGGYGDAAQQAERITYEYAASLYESGNFEDAYEEFGSTSYSDAGERRAACAGALGAKEEEAGNAFYAMRWYGLAGDQESADRMRRRVEAEALAASRVPISAGNAHTVGLRPDGTVVYAGGKGYKDYLFDFSGWNGIVAIAAAEYCTFGLRSDGTVLTTNDNYARDEVAGWTDIIAISAGSSSAIGLRSDGTVVYAGDSKYDHKDPSGWTDIIAVAAGSGYIAGLHPDGTVVVAGISEDATERLGISEWTDIVAISVGWGHVVGLRADGTVVAAGDNKDRQCDVSGWTDIVAVSAGAHHTVGLRSDGTVVAVGSNEYGQRDVSGWTDIVAISAGAHHTVGIRSDGTVVATGNNERGQCDGLSDWVLEY